MSTFTSTITHPQFHPFLPFRHRHWRRRGRLKLHPTTLRSQLPPASFSFDWLPPAALGSAAAAAALSLSLPFTKRPPPPPHPTGGDWILFTSPTPFNRFVLLRCPSISFLSDDVSADLVTLDTHYVRVDSGTIQFHNNKSYFDDFERVEYQRECVRTIDGGVISLDWPKDLDLRQERGLDTVVLLIAGTPEGSVDEGVRSFVGECLRRGLFPVVINPRGCAASPLTTARLFTAADSDDIRSAIEFITRARPWSTFMSVGWGYGANMLTKYLAEAGEKTPLTAATCINNPFDLDEATRAVPYSSNNDKKLLGGLINIFKANKELFQGRTKGFDVEKALSAESVRDFEKAISMVSYGFNTVEEFYSNSSTRSVVGKLKIPVLFVQNDDGTVPLFSIPRALIAENPFTSLLLCTCLPSNVGASSWYQQVTIEWLTAVELGLLKGRHPLVQDIDVTVNPSKGLALVEGRKSYKNGRFDHLLNLAELYSSDLYMDATKEGLQEGDNSARINLNSNRFLQGKEDSGDQVSREFNGFVPHTCPLDSYSTEDAGDDPEESDSGQVLQTAEVVMNMLDVTMPGTLKEEEKKKVLAAVDQGETLIKALQDAVPEDVRGKLTNSVSEILQAQGKNLNFDALLRVKSGLRSSTIKQNSSKNSDRKAENNGHPSDQKVGGNDLIDTKSNGLADPDNLAGEVSGTHSEQKSVKPSDVLESKSVDSHGDDSGLTKVPTESQSDDVKLDADSSSYEVGEPSKVEEGSQTNPKMSSSSQNTVSNDTEEAGITHNQRSQEYEAKPLEVLDSNISAKVEGNQDSSNEQSKTDSHAGVKPPDTSETSTASIPESQTSDQGGDGNKNLDDKVVQPDQNIASGTKNSSFSVSQALDALSGLDDSTQVAVNSVFGVIEDMIIQLEEKKNESTAKKGNENIVAVNKPIAEKSSCGRELDLENRSDGDDRGDASPEDIDSVNGTSDDNIQNLPTVATDRTLGSKEIVANQLAIKNAEKPSTTTELPSYVTMGSYTEPFYNDCLRKYILSKVQKMRPLYLDTNSALFLDYNPKEGRWLLMEQPRVDHDVLSCNSIDKMEYAPPYTKENSRDNYIEPSYVILDSERLEDPAQELLKEKFSVNHDSSLDESKHSIKTLVLDSLKVEVSRRLGATDMKEWEAELAADMEEVANAVYLAVQHDRQHNQHLSQTGSLYDSREDCRVKGKHIIKAISTAVENTSYLKRVLPVGVIVGSSLAAVTNFVDVASVGDACDTRALDLDQNYTHTFSPKGQLLQEATPVSIDKINHDAAPEKGVENEESTATSNSLDVVNGGKVLSKTLNKETFMVGAVSAALGASALLRSRQEDLIGSDDSETSSCSLKVNQMSKDAVNFEELAANKPQSNIVTSLAEKAMSVAAPVVPTKEDGGVDQERLVAMLAELGQKGGVLKLVGKLALLWGGLRGAMSLTDRLISFLRIAERPLPQRVLGFFGMVLVLWSPVLVPLLPTLFHNWATHNSSRIAELACILGLYAAVSILIMQWGKRIRGHEYPLKQYGLDLVSSRKAKDFFMGLVGGVALVVGIQFVNVLLGFVNFTWPYKLSSWPLDLTTMIRRYGQLVLLAGQGIATAAGVALVEELLFRSWLLEEIAADLGYHPGILLSGLAFSLSQRSLLAIPGLWLLSLCLAGARLRKQGSLFVPIGLRTGMMASSYILHVGGFLVYQPNLHHWIAGTHPLQPLGGLVGLLFALLLALALYPRQPCLENFQRAIRS